MRKQLMTGTALAAAAMLAAGGALAADKKMAKPSISVNGSYEGTVGGVLDNTMETKFTYMAMDGAEDGTDALQAPTDPPTKRNDKSDTSALDTKTDAEIHFNGRAMTDNGMDIHVRVELEGQQGGGERIDEYFMSVSGSFGQIVLGGTGGAPVRMLTGYSGSWATGVGETLSFDVNDWLNPATFMDCTAGAAGAPCRGARHYQLQHSRLDTGDAQKITYISPSLGGFQVGLTYSPNRVNDDGNARIDTSKGPHDGIEGAVSYSGKFGDVGFGTGFGMTKYQGAKGKKDDGRSDWLAAARIDFGAFRLAAAHKRVTDDNEMNESQLTDVGVRFVSGSNSFSLTGVQGKMENADASYRAVMGSYARALGPGVKWHANLIWMDSESSKNLTGVQYDSGGDLVVADTNALDAAEDYTAQTGQSENSGMAIVTGLKVTF